MAILTGWIAGGELPDDLSLGEECELRDVAEGGAIVKCQHKELRCEEVDLHLQSGKLVIRLTLVLNDHLLFILGDELVVRKMRVLDGALDQLEDTNDDSRPAELDARFALQSGELGQLYDVLTGAFKFSKVA